MVGLTIMGRSTGHTFLQSFLIPLKGSLSLMAEWFTSVIYLRHRRCDV
jgi:hypothetical protein